MEFLLPQDDFPGNVDLGMLHLTLHHSLPPVPLSQENPPKRSQPGAELLGMLARDEGRAGRDVPGMQDELRVKIPAWSAPGERQACLGQDLNYN